METFQGWSEQDEESDGLNRTMQYGNSKPQRIHS